MADTPPEMPPIQYKAGSAVEFLIPGAHAIFVLETPEEVRAKQKEAMNNARMGIGADEDGEINVILTELDVYVGPSPEVESLEVSIHPGSIAKVKEVTDRFWSAHLENATVETGPAGAPEGMPPHVAEALSSMGVDLSQVSAFPFPDGSGGAFGIAPDSGIVDGPHGPSRPLTIAQFNEAPLTECCCGHQAKDHVIGEHTVEGCNDCDCTLFHTHLEEAPSGDQGSD